MAKKTPAEKQSESAEIEGAELDKVTGGTNAQVGQTTQTTVSPRDPASGLPTGKRMHKPLI